MMRMACVVPSPELAVGRLGGVVNGLWLAKLQYSRFTLLKAGRINHEPHNIP